MESMSTHYVSTNTNTSDNPNHPVQTLSDIIAWSKYARYLPDKMRRETPAEIVERNKQMHLNKFAGTGLEDEIESLYNNFVHTKKVAPSMRSFQFAGEPILRPGGNQRIYNCSYAPVTAPDVWREFMLLLLNGVGVGYSVQRHHVDQLPTIKHRSNERRPFVVPDSVEGWALAVDELMNSFFLGGPKVEFDYSQIREKGALLHTSGGRAPGSEPLRKSLELLESIFEEILRERGETKLKPIEVHDSICIISDAVLSGGIRRSALISLFSNDDEEMLNAKSVSQEWWNHSPWRARANNSAVFHRDYTTREDFDRMWEAVKNSGTGEPGVFWTSDPKNDAGSNPCFTGNTLVATADGRNAVKIEDLAIESNGEKVFPVYSARPVYYANQHGATSTFSHWEYEVKDAVAFKTGTKPVVTVTLSSGDSFQCTPDHRLALKNGEYTTAENAIGHIIQDFRTSNSDKDDEEYRYIDSDDYENLTVTSVENHGRVEDVYDLTVKDNSNFVVLTSGDSGYWNSKGVLAHNCGEIALFPSYDENGKIDGGGLCNLSEVNTANVESQEDLNARVRAASFLGTLQTAYDDLSPLLREGWRKKLKEERLLGVSMTGIAAGRVLNLDLEEAAEEAKRENERVAKRIGISPAFRVTTVKPSGCLSPETSVKTDKGPRTLAEIFEENGVDYSSIAPGTFVKPTQQLYVLDKDNQYREVTNLFVNGKSEENYEIEFEDGTIVTATPWHKFLTQRGWVRADELTDSDDVVSYEREKRHISVMSTQKSKQASLMLDLEVADSHSYQLSNGAVTHNTSSLWLSGSHNPDTGEPTYVSSGIHAYHAPYILRRVRLNKGEALYQHIAERYPDMVEDEQFDPENTAVITFPIKSPDGAITRDEPVEQMLERVRRFNLEWIGTGHRQGINRHNVSVTISVRDDEWDTVGEWLWQNRETYGGISVLPAMDAWYPQLPFEETDEQTYEQLVHSMAAIDVEEIAEYSDNTDLQGEIACSGSSCEVTNVSSHEEGGQEETSIWAIPQISFA